MIVFSEINVVKIRTPLNFSKSKNSAGRVREPDAGGRESVRGDLHRADRGARRRGARGAQEEANE